MKKFLSRWILGGILLIILGACSSSSQKAPIACQELQSETLRAAAANPKNPYDEVGEAHFLLVESLMKEELVAKNLPMEDLYAFSQKSIDNSSLSSLRSSSQRQLDHTEVSLMYRAAKDRFRFVIEKDASPALKDALLSYSTALVELKNTSAPKSFSTIKNVVTRFENEILINEKLSKEEKEALLKATSTYRYSAVQWESLVKKEVARYIPQKEVQDKYEWYELLVLATVDTGAFFIKGCDVEDAGLASVKAVDLLRDFLALFSKGEDEPEGNKLEDGKTSLTVSPRP